MSKRFEIIYADEEHIFIKNLDTQDIFKHRQDEMKIHIDLSDPQPAFGVDTKMVYPAEENKYKNTLPKLWQDLFGDSK